MPRTEQKARDGEAGYFMTDAIVALFLLSSVASGIVGSLSLSQRFSADAERQAAALVLAKACIEETGDQTAERVVRIGRFSYSVQRKVERLEANEVLELAEIRCEVAWSQARGSGGLDLARLEARSL